MKDENDRFVRFLYGTAPGRSLLKLIRKVRADRLIVRFLRSPLSRPFTAWYVKKNNIPMSRSELRQFPTFRDFFVRDKSVSVDDTPEHLISPCDGWLSVFPVREEGSFEIKHSHYRLQDFLQDDALAMNYRGGLCLIFRLCASDYHHYCYIDDGYQGQSHYIEGELHSVQPIACETYPVYTLNRRCWCLLDTEHFGPVVQTEIGALIVGGIVNNEGSTRFCRGMEKGRFELAGSTIVLLFEPGRITLRPELEAQLQTGSEIRVELGMWIASRSEGMEENRRTSQNP